MFVPPSSPPGCCRHSSPPGWELACEQTSCVGGRRWYRRRRRRRLCRISSVPLQAACPPLQSSAPNQQHSPPTTTKPHRRRRRGCRQSRRKHWPGPAAPPALPVQTSGRPGRGGRCRLRDIAAAPAASLPLLTTPQSPSWCGRCSGWAGDSSWAALRPWWQERM